MAGQVRQGDVDVSKSNAAIMNAYNERMANSLNDYNKYVANTKNAAQEYNLEVQQGIANKNTENRTNTANTNAYNQFNQQQTLRDAQNAQGTSRYNNAVNQANIRSGAAGAQSLAGFKANTGLAAGLAGSINQGASQYIAGSQIDKYLSKPAPTVSDAGSDLSAGASSGVLATDAPYQKPKIGF
jgi:hypothetical protein